MLHLELMHSVLTVIINGKLRAVSEASSICLLLTDDAQVPDNW